MESLKLKNLSKNAMFSIKGGTDPQPLPNDATYVASPKYYPPVKKQQ